jgi:hypothetical protein
MMPLFVAANQGQPLATPGLRPQTSGQKSVAAIANAPLMLRPEATSITLCGIVRHGNTSAL